MDDDVRWVVALVDHSDASTAEKWFTAIYTTMTTESPPTDISTFSAPFASAADAAGFSSSTVEQFLVRLAERTNAMEAITRTALAGPSELAREWAALKAQTAQQQQTPQQQQAAPQWDAGRSRWVTLKDGAWVDEVSEVNGEPFVLNQDRTQWVHAEPWKWDDGTAEWSYHDNGTWKVQQHWNGTEWLKLAKDKQTWVPYPAATIAAQEAAPQDVAGTVAKEQSSQPVALDDDSDDDKPEGEVLLTEEVLDPVLEEILAEIGEIPEAHKDMVAEILMEQVEMAVNAGSGGQR
jgi:hypothetical protein